MNGRVIRFPDRARSVVFVMANNGDERGSWTVVAAGYGWIRGDVDDAFEDARWLSQNLSWPVRVISQ